jgi:hypothetical protein
VGRDRDLYIHFEITAKTRTDLAPEKSPEGQCESAYVWERGETRQILPRFRRCTCRWLVVLQRASSVDAFRPTGVHAVKAATTKSEGQSPWIR